MSGSSIDEVTMLSAPDHVLSRKVSGETVLLSLDSEEYYGLDGVGTRLWELVEQGTTFGDAVTTIADEYEVEEDTVAGDLRQLLDDLLESNLVLTSSPHQADPPDIQP